MGANSMNTDTEQLVNAIVKGLVAALGQKTQTTGPVVLVLASPDEKLACDVRQRLGNDADVRFQGEASGLEPDMYVLPELSCSDMVDLAQGKGSSIAMRTVLDLLLQGKQVRTLGFAYRAHVATAPCALVRLYESYVKALASYGLCELAPVANGHSSVRHSLVTAEDIAAVPATATELRVPHGAIVTQLARDEAAARGLNIVKSL